MGDWGTALADRNRGAERGYDIRSFAEFKQLRRHVTQPDAGTDSRNVSRAIPLHVLELHHVDYQGADKCERAVAVATTLHRDFDIRFARA